MSLPPFASVADVAELVRAISSLLWPLVLVAFFFIFREPIEHLLGTIDQSESAWSGEAEFGQDLDRFEDAHAREAAASLPPRVPDDAGGAPGN